MLPSPAKIVMGEKLLVQFLLPLPTLVGASLQVAAAMGDVEAALEGPAVLVRTKFTQALFLITQHPEQRAEDTLLLGSGCFLAHSRRGG